MAAAAAPLRRPPAACALLSATLLLLATSGADCFGHTGLSEVGCPDFAAYTELHWRARETRTPDIKWLVTNNDGGLADRQVNAVSVFYCALITGRAMCIRPVESRDQPPLEEAYDKVNIDWSCDGVAPEVWPGNANTLETLTIQGGPPNISCCLDDPKSNLYRWFVKDDINNLMGPQNATSIHVTMNRGISVALFMNGHHAPLLRSLGLRPDNAFGCALNYLFRPTHAALRLVPPPLLSTMSDENIIKIGIQVRMGDNVIINQTQALDDKWPKVQPFFSCAQQLEEDILLRTSFTRVVWYLMTDSVFVRDRAEREYGGSGKMLLFKDVSIEFSQGRVTAKGLQLTVMEQWLFSKAHYHIISKNSGFGRTAAFASLRSFNVYTMDYRNALVEGPARRVDDRRCLLGDADPVLQIFHHWSGV